MLRKLAAGLLLLVVTLLAREAGAQSSHAERWTHPCTPDGLCVPRRQTHGYYETRWRKWPEEAELHSIKKPHKAEEPKAEQMPAGETKTDKGATKDTGESGTKASPDAQKADRGPTDPATGSGDGSPDVMPELEKPSDEKSGEAFPENKVPPGATPERTTPLDDDPNRVGTPGNPTPSVPSDDGTTVLPPTDTSEVKPTDEPTGIKAPAESGEVKPPSDTDFAPAPEAEVKPADEPKAPEHNLKPMEDDPFKDEPIPDGTSRRSEGIDRSARRGETLDRSRHFEVEDMSKGAVMRWRSPAKLARPGADAFKPSAPAEPRRLEPLLRERAVEQAVGGRRGNPLRGNAPTATSSVDHRVIRTSAAIELDAPRGRSAMLRRSNPLRSN